MATQSKSEQWFAPESTLQEGVGRELPGRDPEAHDVNSRGRISKRNTATSMKWPTTDRKTSKGKTPAKDLRIMVATIGLEIGWLGKVFGSAQNAPSNIAGSVAALLVLTGTILVFEPEMNHLELYWKTTIPLLTMILGYLFGRNTAGALLRPSGERRNRMRS